METKRIEHKALEAVERFRSGLPEVLGSGGDPDRTVTVTCDASGRVRGVHIDEHRADLNDMTWLAEAVRLAFLNAREDAERAAQKSLVEMLEVSA